MSFVDSHLTSDVKGNIYGQRITTKDTVYFYFPRPFVDYETILLRALNQAAAATAPGSSLITLSTAT